MCKGDQSIIDVNLKKKELHEREELVVPMCECCGEEPATCMGGLCVKCDHLWNDR